MKKWIELTNEYLENLKDKARRKIRFSDGQELFAYWDKSEQCFWWDAGESAIYKDDPDMPTHILVG